MGPMPGRETSDNELLGVSAQLMSRRQVMDEIGRVSLVECKFCPSNQVRFIVST